MLMIIFTLAMFSAFINANAKNNSNRELNINSNPFIIENKIQPALPTSFQEFGNAMCFW